MWFLTTFCTHWIIFWLGLLYCVIFGLSLTVSPEMGEWRKNFTQLNVSFHFATLFKQIERIISRVLTVPEDHIGTLSNPWTCLVSLYKALHSCWRKANSFKYTANCVFSLFFLFFSETLGYLPLQSGSKTACSEGNLSLRFSQRLHSWTATLQSQNYT